MARLRKRDEYNRDVTQVWNGIRLYVELMNRHRVPGLTTQLIGEHPSPTGQTAHQARHAMDIIAGQWGMKARPISPESVQALQRAGLVHG